ncbi:hypothetical protein QZH41_015704 [Actinostola sp. cb2023]|nr:hypothetical protein QZH41_015704 [Actinostola sp. cb2023]
MPLIAKMKIFGVIFLVFGVVVVVEMQPRRSEDLSVSSDEKIAGLSKRVDTMSKTITALSRQLMRQQLFVEERIRSDADSGVKQVRHLREGTRNYYSPTHTSSTSVLAIHDHSNNERTVGMGEFVGVLNGVEFRTRHNDYRLYMPHKTSKEMHATENIHFPDVPPEVLNNRTVKDEIEEMRAWFKAWADQDYSVRDYRKYFKPVLCYLEGAWTVVQEGKIDEPFESDRHFVDANTWTELEDKVRFTSYSGRKDNLENYSFLPKTIIDITEEGLPQFAQWNYRILCHPISRDLPLNRFRMVDELGPRMSTRRTYKQHITTRAARFQLNPFDEDEWQDRIFRSRFGLLDELMNEIPGQDNYQGHLIDDAFGLSAYSVDPAKANQKLRGDRYYRWFRVDAKDAMGTSTRHRGFADENLFMAMNSQSKVAGMNNTFCDKSGNSCSVINQKWSYAIPLEIIYLTPLSKWNPYNIDYKGDAKGAGKTVEADGRNGDTTEKKAYNGIHSRKFYMTPVEFFSGNEVQYLLDGGTVNVTSTQAAGHDHKVELIYRSRNKRYVIAKCDDGKYDTAWSSRCKDRHGVNLLVVPDQ